MSCRNENDVQRRVSDSRKEYLLYENGEEVLPQIGDIVIFDGYLFNPYGHVTIILAVSTGEVGLI